MSPNRQHAVLGRSTESAVYGRLDGECAVAFDKRVIEALGKRYTIDIDQVLRILAEAHFDFESMQRVHNLQLRRGLLERHSWPYLVCHEAYFPHRKVNHLALAACLAAHTLSLTHLDYHLDGVAPDPTVVQSATKVPAESAVAYAVKMVYLAGDLGSRSGVGSALFEKVFSTISGFVVERMHEDWLSRYDPSTVKRPVAPESYVHDSRSRLMASGYWEAMAAAAFVANGEEPPAPVSSALNALRKLRQLADESRDVREDLAAGLITLPVILAMRADNGHLGQSILHAWSKGLPASDRHYDDVVAQVQTSEVGHSLSEYAAAILSDVQPDVINQRVGAPTLGVFFDQKVAVLELGLMDFG